MLASLDMISVTQISAAGIASKAVASKIVDCLVEGTAIAVFAACLLKISRRESAATRFAVWLFALLAIAALPLVGGSFRSYAGGGSTVSATHPALTLPGSWALYLASAWAFIAAIGLARVGVGLWQLHLLRKSCVAVAPGNLPADVRTVLERYQGARQVALCVSESVGVPTAIGLMKPAVVIPAWLMDELSSDDLTQVVLHELAHLRRWDDWTNLAQQIVKALIFFHPAAWWIEKQVSLEREIACDDAVLTATENPRAYAECLTHLAEKSFLRRSMALAQAAVGRVRQTSLRVANILNGNSLQASRRGWKPAATLVGGFAIVCTVGISQAPTLVSFDQKQPASVAANSGPFVSGNLSSNQPSELPINAKFTAPRIPAALVHPAKFVVQTDRPRSTAATKPTTAKQMKMQRATLPAPVLTADDTLQTPAISAQQNESSLASFIHPTAFNQDAAVSGAWFVLVESRQYYSDGQAIYQVSVWRVTVTTPAADPSGNRIPAKKT